MLQQQAACAPHGKRNVKMRNNPVKLGSMRLAAAILFSITFVPGSFAANDKAFAGTNGKPFQQLQNEIEDLQEQIEQIDGQIEQIDGQIDELMDSVEDLETQVGSIETDLSAKTAEIAALQTQADANTALIATLQANIDQDGIQIQTLENQISALNTQAIFLTAQVNALNAFKNGLVANGCPAGSSIRQVNANGTTVCEIDTGQSTTIVFSLVTYQTGTGFPAEVFCPADRKFISGGYTTQAGVIISGALPLGNGFSVPAFNNSGGVRTVTVLASCGLL